jgi:hypothetical protein
MKEYVAMPYRGAEWGVWARTSRAWLVFGSRARMKSRASELNTAL